MALLWRQARPRPAELHERGTEVVRGQRLRAGAWLRRFGMAETPIRLKRSGLHTEPVLAGLVVEGLRPAGVVQAAPGVCGAASAPTAAADAGAPYIAVGVGTCCSASSAWCSSVSSPVTCATQRLTLRHRPARAGQLPYALFLKVVQSWTRTPQFQMAPEDLRELAAA